MTSGAVFLILAYLPPYFRKICRSRLNSERCRSFDCYVIALLSLLLFLALYITFQKWNKTLATITFIIGLLGTFLYVAMNPAFSILKLSQQFANTLVEAEKTQLLAAGQSMLTNLHSTGSIFGLTSVWMSSLLFSVLMLKHQIFNRLIPYLGIIGFALLIISGFFATYTTTGEPNIISSIIIAITYTGGGLSTLLWYILLSIKLFKLENNKKSL